MRLDYINVEVWRKNKFQLYFLIKKKQAKTIMVDLSGIFSDEVEDFRNKAKVSIDSCIEDQTLWQ